MSTNKNKSPSRSRSGNRAPHDHTSSHLSDPLQMGAGSAKIDPGPSATIILLHPKDGVSPADQGHQGLHVQAWLDSPEAPRTFGNPSHLSSIKASPASHGLGPRTLGHPSGIKAPPASLAAPPTVAPLAPSEIELLEEPSNSKFGWLMLLFALSDFVVAVDKSAFNFLGTRINEAFDSYTIFANSIMVYLIAQAVTKPVNKKVMDIFSSHNEWVFYSFVYLLGAGLCTFAGTYPSNQKRQIFQWVFIGGRALIGIGAGGLGSIGSYTKIDDLPLRYQPLMKVIATVVDALGAMAGNTAGGAIDSSTLGWVITIWAQIPLIAILAIITYYLLKANEEAGNLDEVEQPEAPVRESSARSTSGSSPRRSTTAPAQRESSSAASSHLSRAGLEPPETIILSTRSQANTSQRPRGRSFCGKLWLADPIGISLLGTGLTIMLLGANALAWRLWLLIMFFSLSFVFLTLFFLWCKVLEKRPSYEDLLHNPQEFARNRYINSWVSYLKRRFCCCFARHDHRTVAHNEPSRTSAEGAADRRQHRRSSSLPSFLVRRPTAERRASSSPAGAHSIGSWQQLRSLVSQMIDSLLDLPWHFEFFVYLFSDPDLTPVIDTKLLTDMRTVLVCLTSGMNHLGNWMFRVYIPIYLKVKGLPSLKSGIMLIAPYASSALVSLIVAIISWHYSRESDKPSTMAKPKRDQDPIIRECIRKVLRLGMVCTLCMMLSGLCTPFVAGYDLDYVILMVSYALLHGSYSGIGNVLPTILSRSMPKKERKATQSILMAARSISNSLGVVIGSVVYEYVLEKELEQRFDKSQPGVAERLRKIITDLSELGNLPESWKGGVMISFKWALTIVMAIGAGTTVATALMFFFARWHILHRDTFFFNEIPKKIRSRRAKAEARLAEAVKRTITRNITAAARRLSSRPKSGGASLTGRRSSSIDTLRGRAAPAGTAVGRATHSRYGLALSRNSNDRLTSGDSDPASVSTHGV